MKKLLSRLLLLFLTSCFFFFLLMKCVTHFGWTYFLSSNISFDMTCLYILGNIIFQPLTIFLFVKVSFLRESLGKLHGYVTALIASPFLFYIFCLILTTDFYMSWLIMTNIKYFTIIVYLSIYSIVIFRVLSYFLGSKKNVLVRVWSRA